MTSTFHAPAGADIARVLYKSLFNINSGRSLKYDPARVYAQSRECVASKPLVAIMSSTSYKYAQEELNPQPSDP
ncbi:MAG: hypothetical protein HY304_01370 [candidate division Zixibacteria bacterium]|nr:hypothetical protein [candidate division Zixibacteria bacterium]